MAAFDPFAAVAAGMVLAIAAARLSSASPGRRFRPAATFAIAALAALIFIAPVVVLAGTPVVVLDPIRILLGAFGVLLGARVARDQAMIAEATEPILRRRALRGVLLALPFALVALSAAIRDTTGESGEDMFYRILIVILPCSLIAAWFGSGALAPGWAWMRSRGRVAD